MLEIFEVDDCRDNACESLVIVEPARELYPCAVFELYERFAHESPVAVRSAEA